MSKKDTLTRIAEKANLHPSVITKVLNSVNEVAVEQLSETGKSIIPGLTILKVKRNNRLVDGKPTTVSLDVTAKPVAQLSKQVQSFDVDKFDERVSEEEAGVLVRHFSM